MRFMEVTEEINILGINVVIETIQIAKIKWKTDDFAVINDTYSII
jgi:hypothetical protein